MARRKQPRPNKSGKCQNQGHLLHNLKDAEGIHEGSSSSCGLEKIDGTQEHCNISGSDSTKILYIDIDSNYNLGDGYFDLAEVPLCDVSYGKGFVSETWALESNKEMKFAIRLKLCMGEREKIRLGPWPLISAKNVSVEILIPTPSVDCCKNSEHEATKLLKSVLVSGQFDGPDEGVSGLSHLISQGFATLRAAVDWKIDTLSSSWKVQIAITKKAFDVSGGLSGNSRQPWKKSMINVMLWLRPEVTIEEAKYGPSPLQKGEVDFNLFTESVVSDAVHNHFDTSAFYEAIKPSKEEPMLEVNFPELLPQLRPYQRRASYWMVQREKNGIQDATREIQTRKIPNPLCVVVCSSDMHSKMYYNPFSGSVSMQPEDSLTYVPGGILADEMGLGKTVELLACILAHPQIHSRSDFISSKSHIREEGQHNPLKRLKRERVECVCGAVNESHKYTGLWVQCDECDAWQHADCVGFETDGGEVESYHLVEFTDCHKGSGKRYLKRRKCLTKKNDIDIMETPETFVCETCSELIQIAGCEIFSGATLIVCPAPILQQWQAEIARHTKRGSLNVQVYGGVKNISDHSSLENIGISVNELADADIVLTTYDVLRSDLSHDSDRHHGDRRSMRFRKRYPVVPTPLTKIRWWRLCLDEAQMVECTTAATEMALRLSAQNLWCVTGTPIQQSLHDLFGLLRFLRAAPFDEHRWWCEVMKNPYERGDVGAMHFTHNFFKQIMWRSTKSQVADELNLPPQEEHLSWLTFSPIEAHFYRRQHESCAANAREYIAKCKDDSHNKTKQSGSEASHDSPLSHGEAAKLLNSLLKLRQACCHPQVGSSGLRSLQQSPMTMDEILQVLVAKAKTEGEEALRKLVVALNGLAALAIIDQDLPHAVSLYREALLLSEENSEDFRLDPLLNLHILHNLAEIIEADSTSNMKCNSTGWQTLISQEKLGNKLLENSLDKNPVKRQRIEPNGGSSSNRIVEQSIHFDTMIMMPTCDSCSTADHGIANSVTKSDPKLQEVPRTLRDDFLVKQCKDIKEKYMSSFISKLAAARQEFRSAYSQVSDAKNACKHAQGTNWWLDALELVEQKKDLAKELTEKIRDSLPGTDSRLNSSRLALRFQDMSGLKYIVQMGLDALENSRENLLKRLTEVDQMMDNPSDAVIERVRQCSNCQANIDGPLCLHCEMDEVFQVYENRLFLLKTGDDGGMIASAEEALDLQKQRLALNRFFVGLSQDKKNDAVSGISTVDENGRNRQRKGHIQVSRSPSELEVILTIVKSFVKARLGKDRVTTAKKHLCIFEAMRKEFTQARSLSVAQAQVLRAHDELKMAISRLRLRLPEEEFSSIDALRPEELVPTNVQLTGEKFVALTELSRIKGQLRYLKGLSLAKQRHKAEGSGPSGEVEENENTRPKDTMSGKLEKVVGSGKSDDETCPVCHEKLGTQMMVFPCGHLLCCKCVVTMVELPRGWHGTSQRKRIMCPTCRYHTDFGNIAYVDDGHSQNSYAETLTKFQDEERTEISFIVQGSFGTKMEAVTRRILWIKSVDPEAKVLVFSSWNDVLDVLEHALHANGINFVRMKGGSNSDVAIRQFKGLIQQGEQYRRRPKETCSHSKPIQVLLLLIRHGANGLNLLEARHVVLIEPLLNPAAEAQAINRVHRIGQQETTFVHRFIVRETVEESIYKLNRNRPINPYGVFSNTRKKDHFSLTLNDIGSLFSCDKQDILYDESSENHRGAQPSGGLSDLPPAVAAAVAAKKRHSQALKNAT